MAIGPGNEFDLARKRAAQQETANLQTQKDAIQRRQAQAGGGISGAFQKQEAVASDASARRLQDANEGIQAQQTAEERRLREIKEGRDFAALEAQKGRDFASGESALGRKFAEAQRLGSQEFTAGESRLGREFASGEARLGREFATSERLGTQGFQEGMLGKQQAFQSSEREAGQKFAAGQQQLQHAYDDWQGNKARELQASQFGQQMDLAYQQFSQQKIVDQWNKEIADKMLAQKGPLESLFGGLSVGNVRQGFGTVGQGFMGGKPGSLGKAIGGF